MNTEERNKKILNSDWNKLGYDTKRERVILEQKGCCNHCQINEWRGKPLTLELEHKDGNKKNNERSNLEAICPNCHSLTDTWRGRNTENGKRNKVSDEELLQALREKPNIKQALESVGLAGKGKNYQRANKLIEYIK